MTEDSTQPEPITQLIKALSGLPSIGRKSAQRLAYFLLSEPPDRVRELTRCLTDARQIIRPCSLCHNYAAGELCAICASPRRTRELICVVERPADILLFERSGAYQGVYHVLGGVISPLDGVGPDDLFLAALIDRVRQATTSVELILSLGTSTEGETTMMYLSRRLQGLGAKVSRLARGIPLGHDLQFVDELTMQKALEQRVGM